MKKNRTFCGLCHQEIKRKQDRYPGRYGVVLIAWVHRGCGLQGSSNNAKARIRRRLLVAGHMAAGDARPEDLAWVQRVKA